MEGVSDLLRRFLCLCLLCLCCVAVPVNAAGITNFSKLVTADYWIENNTDDDTIVLDAAGISKLNAEVREKTPAVYDLESYPATVKGRNLKAMLTNFEALEEDLYLRGNKVSDNYKNILRNLVNPKAITHDVAVKYAVVVKRANLRNLPTGEALYYFAADNNFDALQETALDPCEPVIVLHTSENEQFHYVQAANYRGWVSVYDIAYTDRETWLQFLKPKKFVVVVGKSIKLKTWNENVEYQLGSRIPISGEDDKSYVLTISRHGVAKKTLMGEYKKIQRLCKVKEGDELAFVACVNDSDNIVIRYGDNKVVKLSPADIKTSGKLTIGAKVCSQAILGGCIANDYFYTLNIDMQIKRVDINDLTKSTAGLNKDCMHIGACEPHTAYYSRGQFKEFDWSKISIKSRTSDGAKIANSEIRVS